MRRWAMVVAALAAGPALAQQPMTPSPGASIGVYAYPLQKQTAEQQRDDETQCFAWARQKTGVDPMAQAAPPPPSTPGATPGSGASGAARGAAGGAAIGALTGSAGRGAAVGSAIGAAGSRSRSRQANAAAQAQQQQANAQTSEQRQAFERAFTACMSGRGYSVK